MKKIILAFCLFALASCTSTHGIPISEKKEGWFNTVRRGDFIVPPNIFSMFNPFLDRGFMYCKANDETDSILADPVCYKVRYSTFDNEKPRAESNKFEEKLKEEKTKSEEKTKK
jgi:hypothetical protein